MLARPIHSGAFENENDAVIMRSTTELARNLELKVIAEGLDAHADRDMFTMPGCNSWQG